MTRTLAVVLTAAAAVAVWNLWPGPVLAQDSGAPPVEPAESRFQLDTAEVARSGTPQVSSYADVLDRARPAVVSVTSQRIVQVMRNRGSGNPLEEFWRRFYGLPTPPQRGQPDEQLEERRQPNGVGSGVIISSDGYILTNNHVITDDRDNPADEIQVTLNDGREIEAVLVGRDARTDIALLKVPSEGLPYLRMADSENLRVGDVVFAIGNPLGVGQTVTMGIVSATERRLGLLGSEGYENFIQTDASINPGNSGGALVDTEGRLVGINTAILSRTGGNIGIGFAIPSRLAREIVVDLIEGGRVKRGYLGVSISDVDGDMAEAFGLDSARGALISGVQPGLPADRAGLMRGDVIIAVDGEAIDSVAELRLAIAQRMPGEEVSVEIVRDSEKLTKAVVLGDLDDPFGAQEDGGTEVLEGVTLRPLTPALRNEWNVADEDDGVLVVQVRGGSPYAEVLRPGMLLIEINDEPVMSVEDVGRSLRRPAVNKVWFAYRGTRGFLALRVR